MVSLDGEAEELLAQACRYRKEYQELRIRHRGSNDSPAGKQSDWTRISTENSELRQQRAALKVQLSYPNTTERIHSLRNEIHTVDLELAKIKSEHKSLAIVNQNYMMGCAEANAGSQAVRELEEELRLEKESFKSQRHELEMEQARLQRQIIAQEVKIHAIKDKLKLKVNGDEYEAMVRTKLVQDNTIAELEQKIADATELHQRRMLEALEETANVTDIAACVRHRQEKAILQQKIADLEEDLRACQREHNLSYRTVYHRKHAEAHQ